MRYSNILADLVAKTMTIRVEKVDYTGVTAPKPEPEKHVSSVFLQPSYKVKDSLANSLKNKEKIINVFFASDIVIHIRFS